MRSGSRLGEVFAQTSPSFCVYKSFKNDNERGQKIRDLLLATFYSPCDCSKPIRPQNYFCVNCSQVLCARCRHTDHLVLQIRKASGQCALGLPDARSFLNVGRIQPYIINGAPVLHLKNEPPKYDPGSDCRSCKICHRKLANESFFCSIFCKVEWVNTSNGTRMSMNPSEGDKKLGPPMSFFKKSRKRKYVDTNNEEREMPAPSTPPLLEDRREVVTRTHRRKGIPIRSPMY